MRNAHFSGAGVQISQGAPFNLNKFNSMQETTKMILNSLPECVNDIETEGELTWGVMVIDELGVYGKAPNATICAEADEKEFKDMVFAALAK
jgi:inosine-uridine nucleoside N-ribohydrolase